MVKRLLSLSFFFIFTISTYASHIVGGEFELLHSSGSTYTLNLILYFDVINGNAGARDNNIIARIFRKSDNQPIRIVGIPFISQNRVEYFQPICSNGEVITDRLLYSTTIQLPPDVYNDPEGYYIAWERCCRNYNIDNILSIDVTANPGTPDYAGQTFYLEFPPVVDEAGESFINSSPQLFPPLNDFACPNRPYWVDFAGTDVDEDSLVYTLVTPLNTQNAFAVVRDAAGNLIGANPGPYPLVQWDGPYGLDNILGGSPDLEISTKGFLTLTPTQLGLFVFAVKCEEYRDGIKIGEVIRDFQLLVLDKCPVADPPVVKGKALSASSYTDANFMEVTFPNTTSDANRCIDIQISDLDANKADDNFEEKISFKAIALNFDADDEELGIILPEITEATLINGSVEQFRICFPECPFLDPVLESDFFDIGVVAFDDACTLPLSDTLTIRVRVIPPTNNKPFLTASGNDVPVFTRTEIQGLGKSLTIPIEGIDIDNQQLSLKIISVENIDLAKAGMSFTEPDVSTPGNAFTTFNWNLDCNSGDLDFSEGITVSEPGQIVVKQYNFLIIIEDEDICNFERADTLELKLNIKFPGEYEPLVYESVNGENIDSLGYRYYLNDVINLNIHAKDGGIVTDRDSDNINLTAVGSNFNLEDFGVSFENKENQPGLDPGITTPFHWSLDCDKFMLAQIDSFRVYFITEDMDECNLANVDTLSIDFLIDTLNNNAPILFFDAPSLAENQISTDIRNEISVDIFGNDPDQDSVTLELLGVGGTHNINNFEFEPMKGFRSVKSTLTWTPDCEDLDRLNPGHYKFIFTLSDDRCPNPSADTLSLDIVVNDIEINKEEFLPPNVFTPNGDASNPYFGMFKQVNGQEVSILPVDNCEGVFEKVNVYNRWGKEVYESTDRGFKWSGGGNPAGVYYYQIKFSHITYKGSVSILY